MSAPPASLDSIPNTIAATSILPFVTSSDWLNFRAASRRCYEIIHGHHVNVGATQQQQEEQQNDEESEALWRLALVRDYRFEEDGDNRSSLMYQSIRSNKPNFTYGVSLLTTSGVFTASKAFESWKHWRKIDVRLHPPHARVTRVNVHPNSQLVGPYFLRAASLWRKIEQWCSDESLSGTLGPIIQSTLMPGVCFHHQNISCHTVREFPNGKFSAIKAIYAFYWGQDLDLFPNCGIVQRRHGTFCHLHEGGSQRAVPGLFGGYSAYDNVSHSIYSRPYQARELGSNYLKIADDVASHVSTDTVFNVESGEVLIHVNSGGGNFLIQTDNTDDDNYDDQILRWFENHADRLRCYSVGKLLNGYQSILRYPNLNDPSRCSRAVTRGVEVVASSIFSATMGTYIYSIRMRLLRPEDGEGYMTAEERGFDTCQLASRYWRITNETNGVEEVRGEGVVGYYPMLREGGYDKMFSDDGGESFINEGSGTNGEYFSYQSCTRSGVTMEGELQFEALRQDPNNRWTMTSNETFDVRVAPFPLGGSSNYVYM